MLNEALLIQLNWLPLARLMADKRAEPPPADEIKG